MIKTKWDLSNIYTGFDDPQISIDMNEIDRLSLEFSSKFEGNVSSLSPSQVAEMLDISSKIQIMQANIQIFAYNLSSLNTQNQDVLKLNADIKAMNEEQRKRNLFMGQEFKEIGFDGLINLANSPELEPWKNYFVSWANSIKFIQDESVEKALVLKSRCGSSAAVDLYNELTNSFMFDVKVNSEIKRCTRGELYGLRSSSNPEVRRRAHSSLFKVYGRAENQIVLGNLYTQVLRDYTSEIPLRGLGGVMDLRNNSEQMSGEDVDLLLSEVSNSNDLFLRYARSKAKLLGTQRLKREDYLAPIGSKKKKKVEFEKGVELLLDTLKEFDLEFYEFSKEMLESGRVDVFPYEGKRSGAYHYGFKGLESYVLMNYNGSKTGISTLAHELGHGMHAKLSQVLKSQVFTPARVLCETASTFNELLLSEKLNVDMDEEQRLGFLNSSISRDLSLIHTQVQYVQFERRCHEAIASGENLTYKDYNKIWAEERDKLTGGFMDYRSEGEACAWSSIPHIFKTPFYCYSYAFGNILSYALYEQYKNEGENFVPKYKELLASGGSLAPKELLEKVGLDISKPEFYQNGLKAVESMVDEFERLAFR